MASPLDRSSDPRTGLARLGLPGAIWQHVAGQKSQLDAHQRRGRTDRVVPVPQMWTPLGNAQTITSGSSFTAWDGTTESVWLPSGRTLVVLGGGVAVNTSVTQDEGLNAVVNIGLGVTGAWAQHLLPAQTANGSNHIATFIAAALWTNTGADGNTPINLALRNSPGGPGLVMGQNTGWLLAVVF